ASTLFPYTTLFRSLVGSFGDGRGFLQICSFARRHPGVPFGPPVEQAPGEQQRKPKSSGEQKHHPPAELEGQSGNHRRTQKSSDAHARQENADRLTAIPRVKP